MCPGLRYGPGSDKHRFWDTPRKKQFERMLKFCWAALTVLTRTNLGYVAALQKVYNTSVFHQKCPGQWCQADIRCTRLQMSCAFLFVSTGIVGLRRCGDRTNQLGFDDAQRVVPGQVWMVDIF